MKLFTINRWNGKQLLVFYKKDFILAAVNDYHNGCISYDEFDDMLHTAYDPEGWVNELDGHPVYKNPQGDICIGKYLLSGDWCRWEPYHEVLEDEEENL